MSRRGNCYDNASMESFWDSLKNELVHHRHYSSRIEAEASIREYIEIFYNRQRRHSRPSKVHRLCLHKISANRQPIFEVGVSMLVRTGHLPLNAVKATCRL